MQNKNPIQVADRLFQTLELLAKSGSLGLMELSKQLQLNKSTVHRIVASLIYMGYAKQDGETGKYQLTFKLVDLSNQLMEQMNIVKIVHPHLKKLMEISGETVHFVEQDGVDAVYIDKVESFQNTIQMVSRIGSRIPLYRSGVGKAIVADMEQSEIKKFWEESNIVRMTPYTITNYEDFLHCLEEIRLKGYALDNEENETGVRCIAAALTKQPNGNSYAFSISAPVQRMDNDRIRELSRYILETKKAILSDLPKFQLA